MWVIHPYYVKLNEDKNAYCFPIIDRIRVHLPAEGRRDDASVHCESEREICSRKESLIKSI